MNLFQFILWCRKEYKSLQRQWKEQGETVGLCYLIGMAFGSNAADYFKETFRATSPYPNKGYWLGYTYSEEGYKNRLKYLKKFRNHCIRNGKYKQFEALK